MKGEIVFFAIKIFAKQLLAAAAIIFGVANLVFGENLAMSTAAATFALAMINSVRIDMIEAKPRINVTITRKEENSDNNKG